MRSCTSRLLMDACRDWFYSRRGWSNRRAAALGRAMTVVVCLASGIRGREKAMLEVIRSGPLGRISVEAAASGDVRGYVSRPQVHLSLNAHGKLDVSGAVGTGTMYVTKDLGLQEPYRGVVPLVSGEIGEDFAS